MVTMAQVEGLVSAHSENDVERFKSITLQIAADAETTGKFRFARDLKHSVNGTRARAVIPLQSQEVVNQVTPRHKLEDLFLDKSIKATLSEVIREWKGREKLRGHGLDVRRRLLLTGPPGTGKTASAGAIATALDVPFFVVRLEKVIDSYMGNTAKRLREAFDAIRITEGVFLLDEFDALASSRSSKGATDHQEIRRALNSLLQYLEEEGLGMVIAATNLDPALDRAVWRRFEVKLTYRLPDAHDVFAIVKKVLGIAGLGTPPDMDWKEAAGAAGGLSHAEVEEAVRAVARNTVLADQSELLPTALAQELKSVRRIE
jgi:SpoVK/Ycf46/Vps4 family AAA+-type ATPase